MSYRQDAPFAIQIELTKGCNLQCSFCGINGFQEKPNSDYEFMTVETAEKLASRIHESGWNSRLEFAMHGEPTMNPDWLEIIETFNFYLPKSQIMVTSNGGGLVQGKKVQKDIEKFFSVGGTILAIDEYEGVNLVGKIRNQLDEFALDDIGVTVYEYPSQKSGNPHQRTANKFLTFIAPINTNDKGTHASLNNHCGSGGPLDDSMSNQLCAKPFRELSINFDGRVNLCCNDFIGEYHCGDIHQNTLDHIWNDHPFNSARKFLMARQRSALRPCRGCTAKSYRVGLLPDKFGKVTLPLPNESDHATVLQALSGGPDNRPTMRAKTNIIPSLTLEEKKNWKNL